MTNHRPALGSLHVDFCHSFLAVGQTLIPADRYRPIPVAGGVEFWEVGDHRCTGRLMFLAWDDCDIDWSAMRVRGFGQGVDEKFSKVFGAGWRESLKES